MQRLRTVEISGALFGIVLGTLLHFTYAWSGDNTVVGLFSAINESVWEHTKLLVTPVLLFMVVEWRMIREPQKIIVAKALELLFGVLFIIAFFYTYTGALGIEEILLVDILSFIAAVIIGKYISYRILSGQGNYSITHRGLSLAVIVLAVFAQALFTFWQPGIPLFTEHAEDEHAALEISVTTHLL